ncbi:hypothetical protein [Actinoplanes regularis]|uniref:Uncharacterized protein n=1 Tax=Actinoplanes regularis TaxID=52697 RepID=A0A239JMY1_9ACTN|nr:hypothetical protein [Actinoplanes regularis]SNT07187.1 hypothetical protein SAMN06264365_13655 [Actinoplanes regularis]
MWGVLASALVAMIGFGIIGIGRQVSGRAFSSLTCQAGFIIWPPV